MTSKKNPLNLNALQLKTLTLFQELARLPNHGRPAPEPGAVSRQSDEGLPAQRQVIMEDADDPDQ